MAEARVEIPSGCTLTPHTVERLRELGFDSVYITGNPKTGVYQAEIVKGIRTVRQVCDEDVLVMAGKMHSAWTTEPFDAGTLMDLGSQFVQAGADVVLFPAPGTVPAIHREMLRPVIDEVHRRGGLVVLAVETSQEGSDEATIRQIALESKMAGADIFHRDDAGYPVVALPKNLLTASIALRGRRPAYLRMTAPVLR
ncbi:hypothetical protein [Alicyclobacillus macrosporangiidus]|uniref:DUF7916 domain-containing protein n=1 Tax=Alicyclobacillus macrosporangiidus TaxID=392015 RepID=A0A1I7L962_9BACL|nr:hypothetical protein [Alicyclobacillus macrosporangiidus]SFV06259.1 hypothetical protein SAMN05421543_12917 [Alicyclobacillus macrosporangiidus]